MPRFVTAMLTQCEQIDAQVRVMQRIYDDQSGLQDRFAGAGILSREGGRALRRVRAGRARKRPENRCTRRSSLRARITRFRCRWSAIDRGDVAARVAVRFNEIYESIRLIRALPRRSADGATSPRRLNTTGSPSCGVGWIEGWRGDVFVAIEIGSDGTISRCHCHDPSWQNWPAAGARDHRQYRSRFPADQQIVQSELRGTRPVMWQLLKQIATNRHAE